MSLAERWRGAGSAPTVPVVARTKAGDAFDRIAVAGGLPITVRDLERRFGERSVLGDLSFDVPAGQSIAVVGRSGGGKSTLLRLLMGLDHPTAGTIAIGGKAVGGLQPLVRLMFQDARLLPWQTVLGNVGISRGPDWRQRAQEALDAVGLGDRAADWPGDLSGGQRQRVALARALVDRPGVLLLDEPFGALDALTRADMHALLATLKRERGFTLVLITHDVGEALALGDRVLVLRGGRMALDLDATAARSTGEAAVAALRAQILAAL